MRAIQAVLVSVLLFGLLHTGAYAAAATQVTAEGSLIDQIHMGESMYRDDIVADAVRRLYRIAPQHPEGLAAELRHAIQTEDMARAEGLLGQIAVVAPGSATYHAGRVLLGLSKPEGAEKLAKARLYAAAGRTTEARQLYDALLAGHYPTVDLALEYWLLRTREPDGRSVATTHLTALLSQYPRHAGLLLALANYSFAEGQPQRALRYLRELATQAIHRDRAAAREFEFLLTLPDGEASIVAWEAYLQAYSDLPAAAAAREKLAQLSALVIDPSWRSGRAGLRLLDEGRNAQALTQLQKAVRAYPGDAELVGALGLAHLRTGNRKRAMHYFELAKSTEVRADQTSRWVSLINSTRYWLLLERASQAAGRHDWKQAEKLYGRAKIQDANDIHALIGLGDVAIAQGQGDLAWQHYRKALRRTPEEGAAQRGAMRYLDTVEPELALSLIDQLPSPERLALGQARLGYTLAMFNERAFQAQELRQWPEAVAALSQAQTLDLDDPWLSYRLALALYQLGKQEEGLQAFERHLRGHRGVAPSHYAHALLLESLDESGQAIGSLHQVPLEDWTEGMKELELRMRNRQRIADALAIFEAGDRAAAITALEGPPQTTATRLQVASWASDYGDYAKALTNYDAVLRDEPDNIDGRLGQLEVWARQGRAGAVRSRLLDGGAQSLEKDARSLRRLAALWRGLGENQRALNYYNNAMIDAGMLTAEHGGLPRENVSFTRAMRADPTDDWLRRGIRADAEDIYLASTPMLTISDHFWGRHDGTPGLSRLRANTGIMQFDLPLGSGKAFIRADHVDLDAGTFETDENGQNTDRFGTCSFAGPTDLGERHALVGCEAGKGQKARGTSFAMGWQGERWWFDVGRSPQGFPITNWVGGIGVKGEIGSFGWNAAVSRRPMSNSLLSFAGTRDPRTGTTWGGVIATGASVGLNWDQGGADGVWSDLSHHRLTGTNVADNSRTRVMAGYYRRLINAPHESLTVGVNVMHWRYQKNLGEYTLGHGGYYSPQQYTSISFPVGYARRTADWAFLLEGSFSMSASRSADTPYYPLSAAISGPMREINQFGVSGPSLQGANVVLGSSSHGRGYSLRGGVERRVDSHWVLGAGIDLQRGQDYAPSRFMLYLRYTFEPWQGDLKLRPAALTPYADFR